jgi:hypothetical protein
MTGGDRAAAAPRQSNLDRGLASVQIFERALLEKNSSFSFQTDSKN